MLSDPKIIALFSIVDDLLKALDHKEDIRIRVSDSEVITTAFVAALYFGGHLDHARGFMKCRNYVPHMLEKSRFCRRLHRLSELIGLLFEQMGQHLKQVAGAANYVLDSFPLSVCENMRSGRCRLLKGRPYYGRSAAFHRYYYGVKVQVLTLEGVPVEFCVVPGSENDTHALYELPFCLAPQSSIYMDSGYTDYRAEDLMWQTEAIHLMVQRKTNSHRKDHPYQAFLKETMRKQIETTFSQIKALMRKSIHAVTKEGFLLKVALFVIAYAFDKITD